MVYSSYKKQRILFLYFGGYKPPTIAKLLWEEGMQASRRGKDKFIQRYRQTGTIARKPGSRHLSKITSEIKAIVDKQMRTDNETTAAQLHTLLKSKGYDISLRTILRCRTSLDFGEARIVSWSEMSTSRSVLSGPEQSWEWIPHCDLVWWMYSATGNSPEILLSQTGRTSEKQTKVT